MNALIVIDVQNDFCPNGALAVEGGHEIVALINVRMNQYNTVIMTQDWHPRMHMSFADNHNVEPYSVIEVDYGAQVLWPRHCVEGSEGAEFHPLLDSRRADAIIRKGFRKEIDSYSAFFENDKKTPTGLEGYLRGRRIDSVDFVGLATDFCVSWSAIDAAKLGFHARVLLPLTRAIDLDGSLEKAINDMKQAGVEIVND